MPQGLKDVPATFNRMVFQVLRPLRDFAPSYFDDIFVHCRAEDNLSDVQVYLRHLKHCVVSHAEQQVVCEPQKERILFTEISSDGLLRE